MFSVQGVVKGGEVMTRAVRAATYRLCPQCFRAVSTEAEERYCANDGQALLERCPACQTEITSPYARYCVGCGLNFASVAARPVQRGAKP